MISSYLEPLSCIHAEGSPQQSQQSMHLARQDLVTHLVRKRPTDVLMDGSNERPDVRTVAVLGYN